MKSSGLVISMMVVLVAGKASASTDINCMWDARSAGMGGTGVAFLDSAGAIPTNPALLDQIGKLTLSADLFYIVAQPSAPYTIYHLDTQGQHYSDFETVRSKPASAPLPFLGGAFRVLDRVVIGVAAYPIVGMGTSAQYRPAPDEFPQLVATNKAALGLFEIADAVSVKVLDNLSVAAMWRITYMSQTVSQPIPSNGPPAGVASNPAHTDSANLDINVHGLNFTGLQLGVFYKPVPSLGLGFSYRSKVAAEGTGTLTTRIGATPMVGDAKGFFPNPHAFRAGFAWSVMNDKLLLAADFKYLMYAEAWRDTKFIRIVNGKEMPEVRPAHWHDSFAAMLGTELKATDMIRLRAGYIVLNSATNPDYAQQLMAPPGIQHLVSGGLGIKAIDSLNIDFAAAYLVLQSRVTTATPNNAGIGIYSSHGAEFSLSATYHN